MRLFTDFVIDALQDCEVSAHPGLDAVPESFSRAELYAGQAPERDVLYIVDACQLPDQGLYAFLIASAQDVPPVPALSVAGVDAIGAFNAITRHTARLSACLDDLRDLYYVKHDLHVFCQRFADFIGNPVVAYDDAVMPIAQSAFPRDYAYDRFGCDRINAEYVFKAIPDWLKDDNPSPVPEDGYSTAEAFRTYTRDGKGSTVTCRIARDGKPIGFLDVFEANKHASGGDMRLLEEACRILATPLPFEENRFFESQLNGRMPQSDLADAWLSALRWRADDEVFVVAVNLPPSYSNSMHNIDRAMRVLRSLVPSSVCVQMGAIPVLVANNRLTARQGVINTITSFLETTGTEFYLGVSELLIGVGNLHEGYVHAQFAAHFAMRHAGENGTARFEECQFSFFQSICSLNENKDLVLDATVARMYADDLATGTDNVLTAKTYIETGFNLNATAKVVSVHRNTVAYRLKHIAERYGIDLSTPVGDPGLVFRVLLSCKVLLGDS